MDINIDMDMEMEMDMDNTHVLVIRRHGIDMESLYL